MNNFKFSTNKKKASQIKSGCLFIGLNFFVGGLMQMAKFKRRLRTNAVLTDVEFAGLGKDLLLLISSIFIIVLAKLQKIV